MSWLIEPFKEFNGLDVFLSSNCEPNCGCQWTLFYCACQGGLIVKPPELY